MSVSQPTWVVTFGSAVPIVSGLLTNANADLGLIGLPLLIGWVTKTTYRKNFSVADRRSRD